MTRGATAAPFAPSRASRPSRSRLARVSRRVLRKAGRARCRGRVCACVRARVRAGGSSGVRGPHPAPPRRASFAASRRPPRRAARLLRESATTRAPHTWLRRKSTISVGATSLNPATPSFSESWRGNTRTRGAATRAHAHTRARAHARRTRTQTHARTHVHDTSRPEHDTSRPARETETHAQHTHGSSLKNRNRNGTDTRHAPVVLGSERKRAADARRRRRLGFSARGELGRTTARGPAHTQRRRRPAFSPPPLPFRTPVRARSTAARTTTRATA